MDQSRRFLFRWKEKARNRILHVCWDSEGGWGGNYLEEGCLRRDGVERKEAAAVIYGGGLNSGESEVKDVEGGCEGHENGPGAEGCGDSSCMFLQ